jgi:hypothetical protein
MTADDGGDGSPSLIITMCRWLTSFRPIRPLTAMRMVLSKSGMSPICICRILRLMLALSVAGVRGTSQFGPPTPNE